MSSNELIYKWCKQCQSRGVTNKAELRQWGDGIWSCESCWRYRNGELTKDIPELKIFLNAPKEQRPPEQPREHRVVSPVMKGISQPVSLDKEVEDLAHYLAERPPKVLKEALYECVSEDKQLIFALLTDSRFFSLRELRKYARYAGDPRDRADQKAFSEIEDNRPGNRKKRPRKGYKSKHRRAFEAQKNGSPDSSKESSTSEEPKSADRA